MAAEAAAEIVRAKLALTFAPFERIAARAALPTPGGVQPPADVRERVRWAVLVAARRMPWGPKCFEQGLSAQAMLRRRGAPALLHYGVRKEASGELKAHVWVTTGGRPVVGCEEVHTWTELTRWPEGEAG